jgi:hypothetical protein
LGFSCRDHPQKSVISLQAKTKGEHSAGGASVAFPAPLPHQRSGYYVAACLIDDRIRRRLPDT